MQFNGYVPKNRVFTARRRQILEFIHTYQKRHGWPPSIREIGTETGLSSSSTVHSHLASLEAMGLVCADNAKPRSRRLTEQGLRKIGALQPTSDGRCPTCGHTMAVPAA